MPRPLHGFAASLETVTVIEARVILAHEVWKKKLQRSPSLLLLGLLWLGLPWVIPETFDQSDLDAFPRCRLSHRQVESSTVISLRTGDWCFVLMLGSTGSGLSKRDFSAQVSHLKTSGSLLRMKFLHPCGGRTSRLECHVPTFPNPFCLVFPSHLPSSPPVSYCQEGLRPYGWAKFAGAIQIFLFRALARLQPPAGLIETAMEREIQIFE